VTSEVSATSTAELRVPGLWSSGTRNGSVSALLGVHGLELVAEEAAFGIVECGQQRLGDIRAVAAEVAVDDPVDAGIPLDGVLTVERGVVDFRRPW
jgi:hypothetical protein